MDYDREQSLWTVGGYAAACRVMRDADEYSSRHSSFEQTLLGANGGHHRRVRQILPQDFSARYLDELEKFIDAASGAITGTPANRGKCEIIEDFAVRLPALVVMRMLGIEELECLRVIGCSIDIVEVGNGLLSPGIRRIHCWQIEEFRTFLRNHIERRLRPDDLTLGFVGNRELTIPERVDIAIVLIAAAIQTTARLIGHSLYLMLKDSSLMRELRRDAALIPPLFERGLAVRIPSPALPSIRDPRRGTWRAHAAGWRKSRRSAPLGQSRLHEVRQGRILRRESPAQRALSFDFGPHRCLGLALAQLEAKAAITVWLARVDGATLAAPDSPIRYKEHLFLRSHSAWT